MQIFVTNRRLAGADLKVVAPFFEVPLADGKTSPQDRFRLCAFANTASIKTSINAHLRARHTFRQAICKDSLQGLI
jgi:hypothetical protein